MNAIIQTAVPVFVVAFALAALMALALRLRQVLEQPAGQSTMVEQINRLLPQTQCGQCGYAGCRPYAEAIAAGQALNRCPPGGEQTIQQLAALTGRAPLPLDTRHGWHLGPRIAYIREAECIGCTKCIQACPVDAIVETRVLEYHGEQRGDLYYTKQMLLAVGDRYESQIAADREQDAKYR